MTKDQRAPVEREVTQADRQAMVDYESGSAIGLSLDFVSGILAGRYDYDTRVQAFARHRLASLPAPDVSEERAREIERLLRLVLDAQTVKPYRGWSIGKLNKAVGEARALFGLPSIRDMNPDIAKMQDHAAANRGALASLAFAAQPATLGEGEVEAYRMGFRAARYFFDPSVDIRKSTPEEEDYVRSYAAALSTAQPAPIASPQGETWASVAAWAERLFGPCTASRMSSRAREEMQELYDETLIAVHWTDKAREEAADVLICLSRVPDIWEAVERKMAINRAREWCIMDDGTGYHVRCAAIRKLALTPKEPTE